MCAFPLHSAGWSVIYIFHINVQSSVITSNDSMAQGVVGKHLCYLFCACCCDADPWMSTESRWKRSDYKQGWEFPADQQFPAFLKYFPKKSTIIIISGCLQVALKLLKFQIFQVFFLFCFHPCINCVLPMYSAAIIVVLIQMLLDFL